MRWHDWLGCGLFGCTVAVSGCVATDNALTPSAEVVSRYNKVECFGVNVARAQEPDAGSIGPRTATTLQESPPADVGSLMINGIPVCRIRATVNAGAITDEEVKGACFPMLKQAERLAEPDRSQAQLKIFKDTLDQIVERECVLEVALARLRRNGGEKSVKSLNEAADKEFERQWIKPIMAQNKIKTEAEFKDQLQAMNISLPMMKRQWTRNFMAQEFVRQMVIGKIEHIGHLEIEEYYRKHPEEFQVPDSVQWEDVFVAEALHPPRSAARQRAEMVLARMRNGEKIEKMLEEKLDDGDSSLRDGRGLGRKHGEIKPAEAEVPLFQLKEGEATMVEIGSGYHVIRVVKRDYAGLLPFDKDTQMRIKDKIRNEMGAKEMKKLMAELRKQSVVEYFTGQN
jgi:peptidyl-prolyl cis-trans isomerase SurA